MIKIGPAGGKSSGKAWDDGCRDGIAQIFVSHGDYINSVQFQFVENGTLVLSEKHGGSDAPKFSTVRLSYPSEFLTGISGSHVYGNIRSLTFITNKRAYGPFGGVAGKTDRAFKYELGEDNKFAGFHGTAGTGTLNSIGVYMKPMTTLTNVNNAKVHIKNEKV
ncbi:hypothetical protein RHMOL_Rhmol04G0371700 [Rhododendron molle]|uniref:Uncharacterized protein n=1 Tax=Rhododendron molle TaxID=49168 RepID=A0ACC0P9I8_RHOML|nr:hypothetical protein RHMOL_Rhmol04G0371700 [Rhododendron molle]